MENTKFDLEERTLTYAKRVNALVNNLPKTITNLENGKQLARSSGSVGANYIEANEAISRKDFIHRIKICRKEVKESRFWLNLITPKECDEQTRKELVAESLELMKIFGSIVVKVS